MGTKLYMQMLQYGISQFRVRMILLRSYCTGHHVTVHATAVAMQAHLSFCIYDRGSMHSNGRCVNGDMVTCTVGSQQNHAHSRLKYLYVVLIFIGNVNINLNLNSKNLFLQRKIKAIIMIKKINIKKCFKII